MRALVIDDHPLIQEAVSNVLRRLEPKAAVEAAGDCERGLDLAGRGTEPDLVLLDLNLPGLSGIPALKLWRRRYSGISVVVLSAQPISRSCSPPSAPARRVLYPKSSSNEVMAECTAAGAFGGEVPSAGDSGAFRRRRSRFAPARQGTRLSVETLGLSKRQAEVLELIAERDVQQSYLPRAGPCRTHGEGPRHGGLSRTQSDKPDAGRH